MNYSVVPAMRVFLLSLIMILVSSSSFSQTSPKTTIKGIVTDSETGEPVIGANVFLLGTTLGAATDLNGQFTIGPLAPGNYTVIVSFVSYTRVRIDDLPVRDGETVQLKVTLKQESIQTEEIVVEGKNIMSYEGALLAHQKKSSSISDGISAEQIKRSPDATAGDALRRVSGVSIVDNKFIFVRGTSERYSRALLNNTSLSSTEPDKKAFAFDLIPSHLLESTVIAKSFTPEVPGDFSGGLLKLTTIDFPEDLTINISTAVGYVPSTTFKTVQRSSGGSLDFLGIDDGTRALPAGFPSNLNNRLYSADELLSAARKLPNSWAPTPSRAGTNNNFSVSVGDGARLLGQDFGFIAALSYRTSFEDSRSIRREYESGREPRFSFNGRQSTYSVLWGGLLNLSYGASNNDKFTMKNSYMRSANDEVAEFTGIQFADAGSEQIHSAIRFVSRSVLSSQITGEHSGLLSGNVRVQWRVFGSYATRSEPDYRRVIYARPIGSSDLFSAVLGFQANLKNGGRYFSDLDDLSFGGATDLSTDIAGGTLKIGAHGEGKTRRFQSRLIGIIVNARNNGYTDAELYRLPLQEIFAPENFRYNGFSIDEYHNGTNSYDADESVVAAYAMIDIPLPQITDGLRLIAGGRFERSTQTIQSFDVSGRIPLSITLTAPDFLPSLNLVYSLGPASNLRVAYSETVNRPELRELAPFAYFDFNTQTSVRGNKDLTRARIQNYDVRFEMYPNPGEVLAVSAFYKHFTNAIEQVVVTGSALGSERTFANAQKARNLGVEIESRIGLDHLADALSPLSIRANLTLVRSIVDVMGTESTLAREGRPLQGQSPYVVNLGLLYAHRQTGISASLLYNTYGTRVVEVATAYEQDVVEESRQVLDLSVSIPIQPLYEVKLTWKDILHQDRIFRQAGLISRSDSRPSSLAVGLSIAL